MNWEILYADISLQSAYCSVENSPLPAFDTAYDIWNKERNGEISHLIQMLFSLSILNLENF